MKRTALTNGLRQWGNTVGENFKVCARWAGQKTKDLGKVAITMVALAVGGGIDLAFLPVDRVRQYTTGIHGCVARGEGKLAMRGLGVAAVELIPTAYMWGISGILSDHFSKYPSPLVPEAAPAIIFPIAMLYTMAIALTAVQGLCARSSCAPLFPVTRRVVDGMDYLLKLRS